MKKNLLFIISFMLIMLLVPTGALAIIEEDPLSEQEVIEETEIQQFQMPQVEKISIAGNKNISDEQIREMMNLEVGHRYDEDILRDDLQRIFDTGYFQSVRPEFKDYKEGVEIVIEVFENPVIEEIIFEGDKLFTKDELLDLLELRSGDVLSLTRLYSGLERIEKEFDNQGYLPLRYPDGYYFIDLYNIDISSDGVLSIPLHVGRLNDVIIEGNEKTRDFVILRELDLEKGEPLTVYAIQDFIHELYMTNYFQEITPEPVMAEEDGNKMDLRLNLVERQTGTLNIGGSWGQETGWVGLIDVSEENLLGYGQRLGFKWEFGGTRDLSLDFHEPRLFSSDLSFGFSFYDRQRDKVLDDEDLIEKIRGGSILFGHPITDTWDGRIRFKMEDYSQEFPGDPSLDDSGRTRSITFNTRQDRRDHPFSPQRGNLYDFSLEYAGPFLGADREFGKLDTDLRWYFDGVEADQSWALRLKAGTASGDLPRVEQFTIGGSETLRGYNFGAFSGHHMLLSNVEYRFHLEDNFSGVLFTDMGNSWQEDENIRLKDLNYSLGLGIRMNTPIGQLRLDYAWNDSGEGKPHFSIGQTF